MPDSYTGVQSVDPNYAPTPSVNVNFGPEVFGGATAQAEQHQGETLRSVGNELFSRAIALQQLHETSEAIAATGRATDRINDLHNEFMTKQGRDPTDSLKGFHESVNKVLAEESSSLSSPFAKAHFAGGVNSLRSGVLNSSTLHAAKESLKFNDGAAEAGINIAQKNMAMLSHDDEIATQQLDAIKEHVNQRSQLNGWSDEQTRSYAREQVSKAIQGRALARNETDPRDARRILNEANDTGIIHSDDYASAISKVDTKQNQITSRVEAGKLLTGNSTKLGEGKFTGDQLFKAAGLTEGSGNYKARGPVVVSGHYKGQKGLGIGQVMPGNLQSWLKEANMPAMTEEEYLNSPEAQRKLVTSRLLKYQEQTGSANGAMKLWRGPRKVDPTLGETEEEYLAKFNKNLATVATGSQVRDSAVSLAKEIDPGNDELPEVLASRADTLHTKIKQQENENYKTTLNTITAALYGGPDGKLPTSMDDIPNEAAQQAYLDLKPADRAKIDLALGKNAKGDYRPTAENQQLYKTWLGRMQPEGSDDDHEKALSVRVFDLPLPLEQRKELQNMQTRLEKNAEANPTLKTAMLYAGPNLTRLGIKSGSEDMALFKGTMIQIMDTYQKENNKPMPKEEVQKAVDFTLRDHVTAKGWLWDSSVTSMNREIPENLRPALVNGYMQIKGREPTDAELQEVYIAALFQGMYGKKKPTQEAKK